MNVLPYVLFHLEFFCTMLFFFELIYSYAITPFSKSLHLKIIFCIYSLISLENYIYSKPSYFWTMMKFIVVLDIGFESNT